jgi:hypothetical protein
MFVVRSLSYMDALVEGSSVGPRCAERWIWDRSVGKLFRTPEVAHYIRGNMVDSAKCSQQDLVICKLECFLRKFAVM